MIIFPFHFHFLIWLFFVRSNFFRLHIFIIFHISFASSFMEIAIFYYLHIFMYVCVWPAWTKIKYRTTQHIHKMFWKIQTVMTKHQQFLKENTKKKCEPEGAFFDVLFISTISLCTFFSICQLCYFNTFSMLILIEKKVSVQRMALHSILCSNQIVELRRSATRYHFISLSKKNLFYVWSFPVMKTLWRYYTI